MSTNIRDILELRSGPYLANRALETAASGLAADLARSLDQEAKARDFWFDHAGETAYVTCQLATTYVRPPFALSWEAVLALKAAAHARPTVTATVFVFSDGDRLGRFMHDGSDYLHMTWDEAGWSAPMWLYDEFGEWERVTRAREYPAASELLGRAVSGGVSASGAHAPEGPFATAWALATAPGVSDRGCVVLSLLGERVGRLVDGGKSYIAVMRSPEGEWVLEGWRAEGCDLITEPGVRS